MEKVKLTAKTFDSVMLMLQSPDKESVVLGLTCIEELDIQTGLVYLLLMKKLANVMPEIWREHAPKKYAYMKSMSIPVDSVLTYKKIQDTLIERKVPLSNVQFFMDKFALYLEKELREFYGRELDCVEIKLNLKIHDTAAVSG